MHSKRSISWPLDLAHIRQVLTTGHQRLKREPVLGNGSHLPYPLNLGRVEGLALS